MIRVTAPVFAAALLLAACTQGAPAPSASETALIEAASIEAAPAPPVAPEGFQLSYKVETENYAVSAEIDPAILAFDPALAYQLWTSAKEQLDDLGASADEGRKMADEDAAATGETPWFMAYSLDVTHKATAVFDDVISVAETFYTFTGGAHPNYFLGGGNYRKGEAAALPLSAFVTDQTAFNELVIKALVAEKIARGQAASESAAIESSLRELLAPTPEVPEIYKGNFVLEASTEPGKAGGISVVFSPYDVGPYAEGAYVVTLPAADLAAILTPEWAPRFGGAPVLGEGSPAAD